MSLWRTRVSNDGLKHLSDLSELEVLDIQLSAATGECLAFLDHEGGRYRDPGLSGDGRPGEIDRASLARLRGFMLETLQDGCLVDEFLSQFLSRFRQAHEPVPPPQSIGMAKLIEEVKRGRKLMKNPWTRITWIERDNQALLFASGSHFTCNVELALALSGPAPSQLDLLKLDESSLQVLVDMINQGHFVLV